MSVSFKTDFQILKVHHACLTTPRKNQLWNWLTSWEKINLEDRKFKSYKIQMIQGFGTKFLRWLQHTIAYVCTEFQFNRISPSQDRGTFGSLVGQILHLRKLLLDVKYSKLLNPECATMHQLLFPTIYSKIIKL